MILGLQVVKLKHHEIPMDCSWIWPGVETLQVDLPFNAFKESNNPQSARWTIILLLLIPLEIFIYLDWIHFYGKHLTNSGALLE